MVLKKHAFIWAVSITTAAFIAFTPLPGTAVEEQNSINTFEIEAASVSEGLEDFELPLEDQLNTAINDPDDTLYSDLGDDDSYDDTFDTPDPEEPLEDDLPDILEEPEEPADPAPARDLPVTGEETPILIMLGLFGLAASGIFIKLKRPKKN